MACGKGNANQPIEDFIVHSPAPVDMAAKMSAIYNELSFKVRLYLRRDFKIMGISHVKKLYLNTS